MADTTDKGYPFPESTDPADGPGDIENLAQAVDDSPGITAMSTATRDALAAAQKWAGRIIWNTTTLTHQRCDGSTWVDVVDASGATMTGPLLLPDGSAAAPALSNTGNTDTGLYFPAADQVAISAGGTGAVVVGGTAALTANDLGSTNDIIVAKGDYAGSDLAVVIDNAKGGASAGGKLSFRDNGTERASIVYVKGTGTTPSLSFTTGGTEQLKISSTGLLSGAGSMGAWTAFTPTLSGGWALGNATYVARYQQIGKIVHFHLIVTVGSTTTKGTGLDIALPVTRYSTGTPIFTAYARDTTGTDTFYNCTAVSLSSTTISLLAPTAGAAASGISSTVPFTWATGDQFGVTGTFELA